MVKMTAGQLRTCIYALSDRPSSVLLHSRKSVLRASLRVAFVRPRHRATDQCMSYGAGVCMRKIHNCIPEA